MTWAGQTGHADRPRSLGAIDASPRHKRWRLLLVTAVALLLAWSAAVAWLLLTARDDLLEARGDLRRLRDDAGTSELLDEATTAELTGIAHRLDGARDKLESPVLTPLRVLPVIGRQVRSADAIAGAAAEATAVAGDVLADVESTLSSAEDADTDRVAMLRTLTSVAGDARQQLTAIDLGPDEALIDSLREARAEFAEELAELTDLLDTFEVASRGLTEVVEGPGCYLLLAANNAEMRAGAGMFLQTGELCFEDGHLSLGDLHETSDLVLPAAAVAIPDADLEERWGFLLPNAEWRNLMLSPRFDANAELAADMWAAASGRTVEGVLAVDPVALEVLLESTGPIEVGGQRYDADNVVSHLLVGQYEGFLDEGYDAAARKDRLGEVAGAAVDAFDAGGWSIETLVERIPDAAAGRHLMAWARDDEAQAAWEAMGVAGALAPDTIAVSLLNRGGGRGGGKLDTVLDLEVHLTVDEPVDGRRAALLEVSVINPVEPGTPTYAENPDDPDVQFGVYEGILAVNLPGVAANGRVEGIDGLLAVGSDGPTRVVAPPQFTVGPTEERTFRVRFDLPAAMRSMQVEPSARVPATTWQVGEQEFEDVLPRTIRW